MGYFIKTDLFLERFHNLGEFNRIPVIFRKVLSQEKENE